MDRLVVLAAIMVAVMILTASARTILHRRHAIRLIDPADLGADSAGAAAGNRRVVVFTSPYCHGCREWISALEAVGAEPMALDIAARPELAARYRINVTPRVAVVRAGTGEVLGEWDHYAPRAHDVERVKRLLDDR